MTPVGPADCLTKNGHRMGPWYQVFWQGPTHEILLWFRTKIMVYPAKSMEPLIIRAGHGNTWVAEAMPTPFGSRLPPRRSISSARGIKNGRAKIKPNRINLG